MTSSTRKKNRSRTKKLFGITRWKQMIETNVKFTIANKIKAYDES
jgi:hypothetical protein